MLRVHLARAQKILPDRTPVAQLLPLHADSGSHVPCPPSKTHVTGYTDSHIQNKLCSFRTLAPTLYAQNRTKQTIFLPQITVLQQFLEKQILVVIFCCIALQRRRETMTKTAFTVMVKKWRWKG
jgi:hypothetical protein